MADALDLSEKKMKANSGNDYKIASQTWTQLTKNSYINIFHGLILTIQYAKYNSQLNYIEITKAHQMISKV